MDTQSRKQHASRAAIESYLSNDALHFIRCNPAAANNDLVMKALEYMDGCHVDDDCDQIKELEVDHEKNITKERQEVVEEFRVLIDAALYVEKFPDDEENRDDLIKQAKRLDKYFDNIMGN